MTAKIQPEIVTKGSLCLAGLRYEGANTQGEVPALWDNQFLPRMGELEPIRVGGEAYGVARELAGGAEGTFEYLAAVAVRPGEDLPEGMVSWEIPALTYAVLPAHDVPGISSVCNYYYQEWLPNSEYTGDAPLMMEVYPANFGEDLTILLHFPTRPR